jgi:hypothetical protein
MRLQTALRVGSILVIGPIYPQYTMGHQRQLIIINDTDTLYRIASLNEPVFVDDKSGIDMFAYVPDPNVQTNYKAIKTKTLTGLESILRVDVFGDRKNQTLDFETYSTDPVHYKAYLITTLSTVYTYKLFCNVNGIKLGLDFTFVPAVGKPEAKSDNFTINLSDNVVKKAIGGSFDCPIPAEDQGFPEPYVPSNKVQ